jgi:hypothetical protein
MADNIELNAGSGGAVIATDDDGIAQHQYVKVEFGGDGTFTKVTSAVGLPVSDAGGSLTVDGTVAVTGVATSAKQDTAQTALDAIKTAVETLDNAVSGTELQVDVLTMPSVAVTNAGTFAVQADTELTTADLDTGAGTDTRAVVGLAYGASGGGVLVSTTNPLPVGDNGGSLTVDNGGTFATQAAQSGTWNITNVSGTVSLPTGAATAAKQPALGTAGTASADVLTVQGIASMTALKVDGSAVTQPVSGTFWQATQPVSLATVPSHAVTNAGTFAVQVDGSALTALQLIDDGVATVASAITTKGMAAIGTDGTNARIIKTDTSGELQVDVLTMPTVTVNAHAVTNAGTFAVQVDGSALTALQLIDDPVLTDDAAFTPATSKVMMAGFQADEASTDSIDEGDAGAARMTLDRKQIVTPQPHSAGGLSIFRSLDLDESEEEVSSAACSVYGAWVTNTASTTRWLKFYNATAANTTVGTTTPVITIGIPGNTGDDISANFGPGGMGVSFGTALSVAATTGVADADTGAPAANDVIVNIFYK